MTIQSLKELIKESITEVLEESSCPVCGESVYESENKCTCSEEHDIESLKDKLKNKLKDLEK